MQSWAIVIAAIGYLMLLFVVASLGDRRAEIGLARARPLIYALSLAIYCTSWTFFGSVGLVTRNGLDFLAIYLGPILMVTVAWPVFNHVIQVSKSERITSVADFIASRYGKSSVVGALAALIAVIGTVPYIALQLKAISTSVETLAGFSDQNVFGGAQIDTALFVAVLLALFTVLFGTRHADATEHQDGLMLAVATESIVKLVAFLSVGVFVTFFLFDGFGDLARKAQADWYVSDSVTSWINPATFAVYTFLSFCAFMLLPRQFHVAIVENRSEKDARAARWLFPLYLLLINLFVVPVAIGGMLIFGTSVNTDSLVLALPLNAGAEALSFLVFIGGLSAASAMVIVACVALSIMLSNNIVLPLLLNQRRGHVRPSAGMVEQLLNIRRTAIAVVILLAYLYYRSAGDSAALASIGLLSFAAISQFAPAFFGGLFWRRATARGAIAGMIAGIAMWFYTLLLPTLLPPFATLLNVGPFGIEWLRPRALFGVTLDPLLHGVVFSLAINIIAYIGFSLSRQPLAFERLQAGAFSYFDRIRPKSGRAGTVPVTIAELQASVANYLGYERSTRAFSRHFSERNFHPDQRELADETSMQFAERTLASAIGAASSRLVMSLLVQKQNQETDTARQLLDDASEALQYNRDILQTAIDQVDQGISVLDADFTLSSWNRQFRKLLGLDEDLGQAGTPLARISEAIADKWQWHQREGEDCAKRLLVIDHPWQLISREGDRVIDVVTRAMPGGGYVISWSEITQRVKAANELRNYNVTLERRVQERTQELTQANDDLERAREVADTANIGKTRFLAAVGHDILQPLNAARLYATTLLESSGDGEVRDLAENVNQSLESVEDILSTVLAISRLDSGVLTPNVTDVSVRSLMKRLEVEFQPQADAKKLKLDIVPGNFVVRSDASLLRRLLQNLISNGIKYTEKGSVRLETKLRGSHLIFRVADTGPGIAEEEQATIFQEFSRLEAGRRAASGLGLGLSIVERLSETLDHPLTIQSTLGSGTLFTVSVPLSSGVLEPEEDGSTPSRVNSKPLSMRIFVLDNDEAILDGMKRMLGGWGCDVHCFPDSASMLEASNNFSPELLLADYHLDTETGLEAITRLREKMGGQFPCVLITADRSGAVRQATKKANVLLLHKPVKPAALRAILTRRRKKASAKPLVEPAE